MKHIQISGLTPFTTIDYPGKLAAVLFLQGCPIKCKYCSNPDMLPAIDGAYDPDKIIEWIKSRVGKLEAIVFSGGEALMQSDATLDFMKQIKDLGFKIGLHTNGFYPRVLERGLDIIDWVGLDFKTVKTNYQKLTGVDIAYGLMIESLDVLLKSTTEFEVRITCDPRFINKDELFEIAQLLSARGVKSFAVQKYIPHHDETDGQTSASDRSKFFNDPEFKKKIEQLFATVIWRE